MGFLTNEKLTIVGAGGMIGSNMAQTAAMMKLTPNICLQDVYEPALEGVYEEMRHVTVERESVNGTDLIQKVLQMSSSKTLPDLLMLDNSYLIPFLWARIKFWINLRF